MSIVFSRDINGSPDYNPDGTHSGVNSTYDPDGDGIVDEAKSVGEYTADAITAIVSRIVELENSDIGQSAFLYIAYADDANGTGFTNIFNSSKSYIAVKSATAPIINPVAPDFAGLWVKYKGSDGTGGAVNSVNGQTGAVSLTKANIGLAQVDNTSDANKPVSNAVNARINAIELNDLADADISGEDENDFLVLQGGILTNVSLPYVQSIVGTGDGGVGLTGYTQKGVIPTKELDWTKPNLIEQMYHRLGTITADFQPGLRPNTPVLAINTASGIALTWAGVATATGYLIVRATNAGFTANIVETTVGNVLTHTDSTATVGTTYYYFIRALNGNQCASYPSNTVSGTKAAAIWTGIEWLPRAGGETSQRFLNGAIQGAVNQAAFDANNWVTLATITGTITDGVYNARNFSNSTVYQFGRVYWENAGQNGDCIELRFKSGSSIMSYVAFFGGTAFSPMYAVANAFDGNPATEFAGNGGAGINLGVNFF